MANYNLVALIGNLTKDPKLEPLGDTGESVCEFSIAVNEKYTKKSGEQVENVSFFLVKAYGRQGDNIKKYLTKGSPVMVEGKLVQSRWETDDGQKRDRVFIQSRNVQFLSGKRDDEGEGQAPDPGSNSQQAAEQTEKQEPEFGS